MYRKCSLCKSFFVNAELREAKTATASNRTTGTTKKITANTASDKLLPLFPDTAQVLQIRHVQRITQAR